jgi:signal transduction histidine kinase
MSTVNPPLFQDLLDRYEIEQRLTIVKRAALILIIASVLGFIGDIGYIFSNTNPTALLPAPVIVGIFLSLIAFSGACLVAYFAADRKRIALSSTLVVMSCTLIVVGIQLVWITVERLQSHAFGLDDQSWQMFMAYTVPIALAVVVGDALLLYGTVAGLNLVSIVVLINAFIVNGQDLSSRHQFLGVLIGVIMVEWSVAIIILAMRSGFRRIIAHATDLQVAVERARKRDDLKDQFISSVNHELRNPIMALRGYLDAINALGADLPAEQRQRFLDHALQSCQHLQDLVESILSVRPIEQSLGAIHLEIVDVRAAITAALAQIDPREAKARGERSIRITIPPRLTLWGDRIKLEQIMTNLLSNAMKYSEPGTPIEIIAKITGIPEGSSRWRRSEPVAAMVEIMVRDYGFGIPPEQIPLLFQRFVRLPRDLASPIIGNGLGLFLCRQLAEAMGGRIWVESKGVPGEGSMFHLQLPLSQSMASIPPEHALSGE